MSEAAQAIVDTCGLPVLPWEDMARRRYQRGSLRFVRGYWIGRWREDVMCSDGSVYRRNRQERLGTRAELPTERLARRALDALLAEVNAPGYRPRVAMRFGTVVERWERDVLSQQRYSTQDALKPQLAKHVQPTLGQLLLSEVSAERVQRWLAGLDCAPKTKRNILASVRGIWKTARDWGYVSKDFPAVQMPRVPHQRGRTFAAAEVRRILEAAPEPDATLYALLADTGMRAGEALGLRWANIELAEGWISVTEAVVKGRRTETKSGRTRLIRLSPHMRERLAALAVSGPKTELLFPNSRGRAHRPDRFVRKHLQPLLRALGIPCPPRTGLHAFRHANATELLRAGVPLRTVQTRLGHADPATTLRIYAHVVEADQDRAAEAAAAAFSAAPGVSSFVAEKLRADAPGQPFRASILTKVVRGAKPGDGKLLIMKKLGGETAGTRTRKRRPRPQ